MKEKEKVTAEIYEGTCAFPDILTKSSLRTSSHLSVHK